MTEFNVTYIRDSDRTRVVFVVDALVASEAIAQAANRAPLGFRHAAVHEGRGDRLHIPMDGDDYGRTEPSIPANWTPVAA